VHPELAAVKKRVISLSRKKPGLEYNREKTERGKELDVGGRGRKYDEFVN